MPGCNNKNKFNEDQSSTYVANGNFWSIQYDTGRVDGVLGEDTVRFGAVGTDQLSVPNTTFGMAYDVPSSFLDHPIDGILGLAFTSVAVDHVVPPLINAVNQGLLDQPIFTVYLQERGSSYNVPGGNSRMIVYRKRLTLF